MNNQRPDPDALLEKVQRDVEREQRGRLKIFFGAVAGVGKTYAMLQAGQQQRAEKIDVVVGYVETHGRAETAAFLQGLEILPPQLLDYRGTQVREFDLDAALKRRPTLILVDELAHSNVEGSRHPKRWQDVEELIAAGIDVYTTMNVQHLESLNDVIGQITEVRVWETVPDKVFDQADEVELVDLPPDELLKRLYEGKVYIPQQAERAAKNFFRKGNLIALRELSLRRTAQRVDAQMRDYRDDHAISDVWPVAERILVGVGPYETASRLVRAGRRLAMALKAEWIVAYVETPALQRLSEKERDGVLRTLRLAEQLGAETVTLSGAKLSDELLAYARARNVTKIVLGKPTRTGWRRWLLGSAVDTLVKQAHDIDVYLMSSTSEEAAFLARNANNPFFQRTRAHLGLPEEERPVMRRYRNYAWAAVVVLLCTGLAALLAPYFAQANLIMLYLLGVVSVATRFGRGPSILASVLSVAAFDFFWVPPFLTFAVADTQYLVTFAVMLLVALVISNLTAGGRLQAKIARHRERRTAALYAMSRELAGTRGEENLLKIAVRHISEVFASQVAVLVPDAAGRITYPKAASVTGSLLGADLGVAQWVYDHRQRAGLGADTLPGADALYLPLSGAGDIFGVLAVLPADPRRVFLPEQLHLLETFTEQVALAIERARLATEAQDAQLKTETERLRNSLLSAISHDLRTPLAVIAGSSSSLIEGGNHIDEATRTELSQTVYDEAQRMSHLVNNLLDMTRLQSGAIQLNKQWYPLEEVIGSVLNRLRDHLADYPVTVNLPADLPLVQLDGVLIEQALINLLENAAKYAPPGTRIEIGAEVESDNIVLSVADNGSGFPPGDEERVFDKFYRAQSESATGGVGLGLTICRAIVDAHGGKIWAGNRPSGGAVFRFSIPITETPPAIEPEPVDRFS